MKKMRNIALGLLTILLITSSCASYTAETTIKVDSTSVQGLEYHFQSSFDSKK